MRATPTPTSWWTRQHRDRGHHGHRGAAAPPRRLTRPHPARPTGTSAQTRTERPAADAQARGPRPAAGSAAGRTNRPRRYPGPTHAPTGHGRRNGRASPANRSRRPGRCGYVVRRHRAGIRGRWVALAAIPCVPHLLRQLLPRLPAATATSSTAPLATATAAMGRRGMRRIAPRPQPGTARKPRIRRRSGDSAAARCGRSGLPRPHRRPAPAAAQASARA